MNPNVIANIQKFTLKARHDLEREAAEQLEGIYGWLPDGSFSDVENCPALLQSLEAKETRKRLEQYKAAEKEAGIDPKTAREALIRETAFTWLNRFVALRMMEERKLIKEIISRLSDSNAFKLWIADEHDKEASALYEKGDLPVDALGEGPRQKAYRRFLLWECARLGQEVSVLFDPGTLASRLFPRPLVLRQLIKEMNDPDLLEAWRPGNEETIGWVYQCFNSEELKAAFEEVRVKGKKFEPKDIPAVTQLFTIRWVVRFLVENSLGRFWAEMHPDSKLIKELKYLVPSQEKVERPVKLASEISFLDPACGSMHFGLIAFDLFEAMYKEEIENAGKPGWPEKPSVSRLEDIPAAIIKNNIHGIDIDLRAVQLSALTLFLRARSLNPKCEFTDRNLACANVEHITAGRLDSFIRQAEFEHPIFERILNAMAEILRDSDNLGSLLRPEKELRELIEEERKKAQVEHIQKELRFPDISNERFETQERMAEFFGLLEDKILERLDELVHRSRDANQVPAHFAAEAAKGLRFMRLVQHRYDVVATNPPYLSARKMNKRLAELLAEQYPDGKSDFYAAFIQRCSELLVEDGLLGMLTMHSFMFISRYEQLRNRLRNEMKIETLVHFAGGLFAVGNPGTLQTAAFVLRRESDYENRENSIGTYFRLVHESDAEAKREAFESALAALRSGQKHPKVFHYKQKDFDIIPGKPWVYWIPESIIITFLQHKLLKSIAPAKHGLSTCNNKRYLRKWWELPRGTLRFDIYSIIDGRKSGLKWFPYMKGGTVTAWYGNQEHSVNWLDDGKEIKADIVQRFPYLDGNYGLVVTNPDYYFRRGVTWSLISSKGFAARLSPGGFIFDVAGMTCFPPEDLIEIILAVLNSRVAKFILSVLNPTINYQIGDIERLPVPAERNEMIVELVKKCIELKKQESRESEITYDFIRPAKNLKEVEVRKTEIAGLEEQIDNEVSKLYGLSENDLEIIERELASASDFQEGDEESEGLSSNEEAEGEAQDLDASEWALSWISYAAGIAIGRFEVGSPEGLGRGDFAPEVINALKPLISSEGILVNDPHHPLDFSERCLKVLEVLLGEKEASARVKAALGDGDPLELLRDWFGRFTGAPKDSFWKYHFKLYRKRPVYWPLQSPGRLFTVWVFHEKFTHDTLFSIRNNIVEPRLRMAERAISDLCLRSDADRLVRREVDRLRELSDDLREFSKRLREVAEKGYVPHIDDGVLLNAAPLHQLLPYWPETEKAWKELEKGEYDWAQQAMEYWPERVREKCKTNRSFAIAHGLEELCPPVENENRQGKAIRKKGRPVGMQ